MARVLEVQGFQAVTVSQPVALPQNPRLLGRRPLSCDFGCSNLSQIRHDAYAYAMRIDLRHDAALPSQIKYYMISCFLLLSRVAQSFMHYAIGCVDLLHMRVSTQVPQRQVPGTYCRLYGWRNPRGRGRGGARRVLSDES